MKPAQSKRPASGSELSGTRAEGGREGENAGGHVEPEDGRPAAEPHQDAADDRSHGQRQAGHGRPDAQGPGPVAPVGVEVAEDGERARLAGRRPDAHDAAGRDEDRGVGGERAEHRAGDEDHHAAPASPCGARAGRRGVPKASIKAANSRA